LTYSRTRFQYGSNISAMRSRFIEDIPETLMDVKSETKKYSQDHSSNFRSFRKNSNENFNESSHKPERRIVIDDDLLDGVLAGDFDIDKLIES
ncbi:hypothetical protein KA089_02125, partial [Candidatus Woesebacteria bacterium]|nr:hypothetical protein [Candidatus Woesebacteria bacterium]